MAGFFAVQSAGAFGAHVYIQAGEYDQLFARTSGVSYLDAQRKAVAECEAYKLANAARFSGSDCVKGRWFINTCHGIATGNRPGQEGNIGYSGPRSSYNDAVTWACQNAGRYFGVQLPNDPPLSGPRADACSDNADVLAVACRPEACPASENKTLNDSHASQSHHRCECLNGFEDVGGSCVAECGANETRNQQTGMCDCDNGFEDVGGSCIAECATGMERVNENCVPECATGMERVNENCVPECATGMERVNENCVPECGANETRNQQTGNCECGGEFEDVGGECIAKCPGDRTRDDTSGMCREAIAEDCPDPRAVPGAIIRNYVVCGLCESGEEVHPDRLRCVAECGANETRNQQTGDCECSNGFEDVGGSCVAECGANSMRNQQTGVCDCDNGFEDVSGSCVAECGANSMRNQQTGMCDCDNGFEDVGGSCEPECTTGMERVNGNCVAECGANETRNQQTGNCECSNGFEDVGGSCEPECTTGMERVNGNCVLECGANETRNQQTGMCDCDNGFEDVGGSCEPECGANSMRNQQTGMCGCNNGFEDVGGSCVPECGANETRNNGVCVCISGYTKNNAGECEMDATPPTTPNPPEDCMGDLVRNNGVCECPDDMEPNTDTADANDCRPIPVNCTAPMIRDAATNTCKCPDGMEPNTDTADENDCRPIPVNCTPPMIRDSATNTCKCPDGEINVGGACQTPVDCAADGPAGSESNAANECVCPSDKPVLYTVSGESHCVETLPAAGRYTENECESADWRFATAVNNSLIRETCEIPVRVELSFAPPESSGVRAQAVDAADGGVYDSCILREHDNFGGADLPKCEDETLFGASGLPQKPAGFDAAGASARIVVATTGIFYNDAAVQRFTFSRGGGGDDIDRGDIAIATGAAVFVGLVVYGSWDGNPNAFSFSPLTSFSHNNGRTSYSYGSRVDFQQDELSAYWSATRLGGVLAENWRYSAGIKYGKEFWSANFDSINTGGETEIDFGISAEWKEGVWRWQSGVRADYRTDGMENDFSAFWRNSLTAELGEWRLMPSADFRWRESGGILDGGNLRIDLRREF